MKNFYAFKPLTKEERFNNAINLLERFLIQYTGSYTFVLVEKTTNNFNTFKEEVKNNGYMFISSEGNDHTIYTKPYYNTIARLFHDNIHLDNNLDFSLGDEKIVCYLQIEEVNNFADKEGSCTTTIEDLKEILYHDIISQALYFKIYNKFVINQKKFVYNLFLNSEEIKEEKFADYAYLDNIEVGYSGVYSHGKLIQGKHDTRDTNINIVNFKKDI